MIKFPNHSRSYNRTRRAVQFWGYDSAIEVSFFINEDALTHLEPEADLNEAGFLAAFDAHRSSIVTVAARKYVRNSKHSYELIGADFRS
jgi:hypothetical protein